MKLIAVKYRSAAVSVVCPLFMSGGHRSWRCQEDSWNERCINGRPTFPFLVV